MRDLLVDGDAGGAGKLVTELGRRLRAIVFQQLAADQIEFARRDPRLQRCRHPVTGRGAGPFHRIGCPNVMTGLRKDLRDAQTHRPQPDHPDPRLDKRQRERMKRHAVAEARTDLADAIASQSEATASLSGSPGTPTQDLPEYRAAMAMLAKARLDLDHAEVRAPVDGIVGLHDLQVGEYINVGQTAMPLVATSPIWVEANFKETELEKMKVGQPATIEVDSYPGVKWKAHVASIAPASGAEFSVLPPQNATGNWVKVVQRIPVAFREDFAPQQRLFFALEAMGLLEKLHVKVFQAIHVERLTLNTDASILSWIEKQGVDKTKFADLAKSFGVASKLKRAVQLQNDFKIEGVPSLGVAGKYYVDGTTAGSMDRALQVTDSLLAQVRQGRA